MPGLRVRLDGERLEVLRTLKGFTQPSLAQASGVSTASVQRMEKLKGRYVAGNVVAVARTLGVDLAELGVPESDRRAIARRENLISEMRDKIFGLGAPNGGSSGVGSSKVG
jgi:transcriptional regulator with XRE-family HTH domain